MEKKCINFVLRSISNETTWLSTIMLTGFEVPVIEDNCDSIINTRMKRKTIWTLPNILFLSIMMYKTNEIIQHRANKKVIQIGKLGSNGPILEYSFMLSKNNINPGTKDTSNRESLALMLLSLINPNSAFFISTQ